MEPKHTQFDKGKPSAEFFPIILKRITCCGSAEERKNIAGNIYNIIINARTKNCHRIRAVDN